MKNSRKLIAESQLENTWKTLHGESSTKEKHFLHYVMRENWQSLFSRVNISGARSWSENKISYYMNKLNLWQVRWAWKFSMPENKGLSLRTSWPASSTIQEVRAQCKYQLSPALHWVLLASRVKKHWKLYHTGCEMEKNTTTHRLLFWSHPICLQINKL